MDDRVAIITLLLIYLCISESTSSLAMVKATQEQIDYIAQALARPGGDKLTATCLYAEDSPVLQGLTRSHIKTAMKKAKEQLEKQKNKDNLLTRLDGGKKRKSESLLGLQKSNDDIIACIDASDDLNLPPPPIPYSSDSKPSNVLKYSPPHIGFEYEDGETVRHYVIIILKATGCGSPSVSLSEDGKELILQFRIPDVLYHRKILSTLTEVRDLKRNEHLMRLGFNKRCKELVRGSADLWACASFNLPFECTKPVFRDGSRKDTQFMCVDMLSATDTAMTKRKVFKAKVLDSDLDDDESESG